MRLFKALKALPLLSAALTSAGEIERRDFCPNGQSTVQVHVSSQIIEYPVYVSTVINAPTIINIWNGPTYNIYKPTTFITNVWATYTETKTYTVTTTTSVPQTEIETSSETTTTTVSGSTLTTSISGSATTVTLSGSTVTTTSVSTISESVSTTTISGSSSTLTSASTASVSVSTSTISGSVSTTTVPGSVSTSSISGSVSTTTVPGSVSTSTLPSSISVSVSTVSSSSASSASAETFILAIETAVPARQVRRRQATVNTYIRADGSTTSDCRGASIFQIIGGQLFSNGGYISTNATSYSIFSIGLGAQYSTTFSATASNIIWSNIAFANLYASFYLSPSLDVFASFQGSVPEDFVAGSLVYFDRK
ncbi:hypothetical protein L228DRAFT_264309 [Xylona heveae TC161]|uniref:DUF7908 domain-containing protein n=1 Tax=Xylona heveae (strain CBS 132557 / TC161) TaxID=1328760 RepID=A0A165J7X7_XYLHT|nr:hypothetical protein L228DRAFT_264309 [Xylona heveae TC161]KZF25867.1 hypothetical protein L228DRAFT_264309 [Xylona heveae TC161]